MGFSVKSLFLLCFLSFTSVALLAQDGSGQVQQKTEFHEAWLELNGKLLKVELADSWELRAQGLMFRTELCEDCGMLFQFDRSRIVSMWMKNTLIPLDVAYFERSGKIVDIKQMQPLDLSSVPSSAPVFYALEMNQGWFAKNGVKEGDLIKVSRVKPE